MQPFPTTLFAGQPYFQSFAGIVIDDASVGTVAWTNPMNAQGGSLSAFASWISGGNNIISHYLNAQNFGFSIPLTSAILGVQLGINRKNPNGLGNTHDSTVSLIKGGVISGNNKALATNWSTTEQYANYGSSSDLWGLSLTPSDINSSNFGAAISVFGLAKVASASVYAFRITVYYQ